MRALRPRAPPTVLAPVRKVSMKKLGIRPRVSIDHDSTDLTNTQTDSRCAPHKDLGRARPVHESNSDHDGLGDGITAIFPS